VGRACPYCGLAFHENVATEQCDSCGSLHHDSCWQAGHGCAIQGCAGAASATGPAAAPVPISPPVPTAPAYSGYGGVADQPPPSQSPTYAPRQRPSQVVLIPAAVIALLAVAAAVVLGTGVLAGGAHTVTQSPPGVSRLASTATPPPTTPAAPTEAEQASDRRTIMSLLAGYQTAYSQHDLSTLEGLFSPEITRHGLSGTGCAVAHGRSAVLEDYQSQFEQGSGAYELVGLSEGQIQLQGSIHAHLDAHYRITPGGTGYVNFRFVELGEGWKISEVYATCA
jgi:hypothetical protein